MGALQANNIRGGTVAYLSWKYFLLNQAGKVFSHFWAMPDPPDAIFATEDFTALGAISELKERKIKIPGEVGVIGFANELFGKHITPSLSTVDQQRYKWESRPLTY